MDILELRQKAESGRVVAQSVVGICYLDGTDAEVNYSKRSGSCQRRVHQGQMANLARTYAHGWVTEKNLKEAVRLCQGAIARGESLDKTEVDLIYDRE